MNKKEPSWLSARIDALIAERDAAIKLAADRLEQMNADRKQHLDLRDKLPFAYYDPSSGQFALDKSDLPIGAQVWPLFQQGETP